MADLDDQDKADKAELERLQFEIQGLDLDLQQKRLDLARKARAVKERKKFAPTSGLSVSDMTEVKSRAPLQAGAARPGVPTPSPR